MLRDSYFMVRLFLETISERERPSPPPRAVVHFDSNLLFIVVVVGGVSHLHPSIEWSSHERRFIHSTKLKYFPFVAHSLARLTNENDDTEERHGKRHKTFSAFHRFDFFIVRSLPSLILEFNAICVEVINESAE